VDCRNEISHTAREHGPKYMNFVAMNERRLRTVRAPVADACDADAVHEFSEAGQVMPHPQKLTILAIRRAEGSAVRSGV